MRIHHPAAVRAVAFSPVSSQSRHVVAALDNGSIYRWDLNMGQRGQLDRLPVAHSGPLQYLDWIPPSSATATTVPSTRQSTSSTWYGGAIEEILPSAPIAGGASAAESDNTSPGWIVSGGMDRCVKVGTLKIILYAYTDHQGLGLGPHDTHIPVAHSSPAYLHVAHVLSCAQSALAPGIRVRACSSLECGLWRRYRLRAWLTTYWTVLCQCWSWLWACHCFV